MSKNRIYNYEWKEKFITQKYGHNKTKTVDSIYRAFKQVGDFESKIGKDVGLFTQKELIQMFEETNWIFYSSFQRSKFILKTYNEWFKEQVNANKAYFGFVFKKISGEKLKNTHFKNFNELKECIDAVALHVGKDQFLMTRTILYLLWSGFTVNEICKMESSSILSELKSIGCDNNEIINTCSKCSKITFFETKGKKGSIVKWKLNKNKYLIRKIRSSRVKESGSIDEAYIRTNMIRKFNNIAETMENPKSITISSVYDSGLFNRLMEYEQQVGVIKSPKDIKGLLEKEDRNFSYPVQCTKFHDYKKWKSCFFR